MIPFQSTYEQRAGQRFLAPPEEEPELLRRAQQQDAAAFTKLCRLHIGSVYATCMRMLANEDKAKDVVQEIIIDAWEKLPTYRYECPFSAWLHRIAVNASLDYLKTRSRLNHTIEFTNEIERYEEDYQHSSFELTMDIEEALALLPTQARTVLVLHDIEGYRHTEIAAMLGIATGTSKAHLHGARLLLKEILQQ